MISETPRLKSSRFPNFLCDELSGVSVHQMPKVIPTNQQKHHYRFPCISLAHWDFKHQIIDDIKIVTLDCIEKVYMFNVCPIFDQNFHTFHQMQATLDGSYSPALTQNKSRIWVGASLQHNAQTMRAAIKRRGHGDSIYTRSKIQQNAHKQTSRDRLILVVLVSESITRVPALQLAAI
jgi:hypothetical protein